MKGTGKEEGWEKLTFEGNTETEGGLEEGAFARVPTVSSDIYYCFYLSYTLPYPLAHSTVCFEAFFAFNLGIEGLSSGKRIYSQIFRGVAHKRFFLNIPITYILSFIYIVLAHFFPGSNLVFKELTSDL